MKWGVSTIFILLKGGRAQIQSLRAADKTFTWDPTILGESIFGPVGQKIWFVSIPRGLDLDALFQEVAPHPSGQI